MAPRGAFGRVSVVAWANRAGGLETRAGEGGTPITGAAASSPISETGFVPAAEKYEIEASIGRGGMGEVLLVQDRDLQRQVAMKVLKEEMAGSVAHRMRFVAEAQATSQLEHPGILPVHDIGITPAGRVYFTMKLVRGRTLGEVLRGLLLGVRAIRREYDLHKLVSLLERIAEALHFAHERGVIHRDLKPENIMLGDFGEVHVLDWGIAKVAASGDDASAADGLVHTPGTDLLLTQAGTIKGTIPYMSPEQARGDPQIDRRSDIYALGCLLYEVMTLHAPFEGEGIGLLVRVRKGDFPPVTGRNPRRTVPAALADLCARAMSLSPDARPGTAREFGEELRAWLDGRAERARRQADAERLAAEGKAAAKKYRRLEREVVAAERFAEEESARYQSWQPVREKLSAIQAAKRVEDLRADVALAFADTTYTLNAALIAQEDNATARAALADLWRERLVRAEHAGERPDVVHAEAMIRRYDDGSLAAFLAGDGSLDLTSDPAGADVTLCRFEERDGVLTPVEDRALGATPVRGVVLPMGSYLCLLRKAGYRDVRYPVHISRNRAWKATVRMLTDAQIGADFVYVPAGPFICGEGRDRCERALGDFLIRTYPVTFGEYAEFLTAIEREEGLERATELTPGTRGDGPYLQRGEDGVYRPLPNNIEGPARERCIAVFGEQVDALLPVAGVSWHDAVAYCAWKTRTTGREWRLPTAEEREKAARGVDGRSFPWGELADASLCKCRGSRDEMAQPEPVGTFPTAVSVYGMGDAAGNSWDWTDSLSEPHVRTSDLRVVRGGSWNNALHNARTAFRNGFAPDIRGASIGIRPARSVIT